MRNTHDALVTRGSPRAPSSTPPQFHDRPLRLLFSTLLRLLFPSWAFFDEAVAAPLLELRLCPAAGQPWPWEAAIRAPTRRWWHVVVNPAGTYALAAQGQVERLHLALRNDEADCSDAVVTRALVAQLAEARVPAAWRSDGHGGWQWRIVVHGRGLAIETIRSEVLQ